MAAKQVLNKVGPGEIPQATDIELVVLLGLHERPGASQPLATILGWVRAKLGRREGRERVHRTLAAMLAADHIALGLGDAAGGHGGAHPYLYALTERGKLRLRVLGSLHAGIWGMRKGTLLDIAGQLRAAKK